MNGPSWLPYLISGAFMVVVAVVTAAANMRQKKTESERPSWDGMAGQMERAHKQMEATTLRMEKLELVVDEERRWRRRLEDEIEELRDHTHEQEREQAQFCRETVQFVDALIVWVLATHRGAKPAIPEHLRTRVDQQLWARLDVLRTEHGGPPDDGQPDDITRTE